MGNLMETSSHGIWPSFRDANPGTRMSARSSTWKKLLLTSTFSTSAPLSTTHLIPGDDPSRFQLQRQLTILRWTHSEPHQLNVTGVWWLELDHPAALILTLLHTSMKFNAFKPDPFFGNDGYDVVAAHNLFALAPHVVDAQFHVRHA
jgi:hypothetical protein